MTSIFTAEVEAIKLTLKYIKMSPRVNKKLVIFCDSKSVLENIDNQESKNPLMIDVLEKLQELFHKGFTIRFCWIPSHVGISGNEQADLRAKDALNEPEPLDCFIPYTDFWPKVKNYIRNLWKNRWTSKHIHERPIKSFPINPNIRPYYINGLCRKDEVVIHRIRIGHTRLTHSYLMEDSLIPMCIFCQAIPISVKHLMIECPQLARIRSRYYQATDMGDLFERFSLKCILEFLKKTRLYYLI